VDLALDHVIVAVPDLDVATAALQRNTGLRATPGGRHPSLGTQNRLVPLGSAYLEIATVADERLAAENEFGRAVLGARDSGPRFTGWVVRTREFEQTAPRWQSDVVSLARDTPSGTQVRWRMAGLDNAQDPSRPLLIEWEDEHEAPAFADPVHPVGRVTLDYVEIGDPARLLGTWLPHIDHVLLTASGLPGVHAVNLKGEDDTKLVVTENSFNDG
jgi:hypothetical protein